MLGSLRVVLLAAGGHYESISSARTRARTPVPVVDGCEGDIDAGRGRRRDVNLLSDGPGLKAGVGAVRCPIIASVIVIGPHPRANGVLFCGVKLGGEGGGAGGVGVLQPQ